MATTREKFLKSSLVRVRNTISDKYRKLHREDLTKNRDLQKRYAPITKSIDKLIESKSLASNANSKPELKYEPVKVEPVSFGHIKQVHRDNEYDDHNGGANGDQFQHDGNQNDDHHGVNGDQSQDFNKSFSEEDDMDVDSDNVDMDEIDNLKSKSTKNSSKKRKKVIDSLVTLKKPKIKVRNINEIRELEQRLPSKENNDNISTQERVKTE